jgi:1,4-dihydroxy-2-naphthoyl-CoA synthase
MTERDPFKLVPRPTVDQEIRDAAVAILREAIADVVAGKVLGIIVLCKETDGMWMHRASGTISVREDIGAIEMLKWDRIARTRE